MSGDPDSKTKIDELDRRILGILAEDPRMPYSDMASALADEGHELSSEAIRQRVSSLLERTTSFFLLLPDHHDWDIVMFMIQTVDRFDAKREAFETISDMDFWFVGRGFGTVDIYATATVNSVTEIDDLLTEIEELERVAGVDFFIETARRTAVEKYLRVE
jgi:DNA-binding Lrp family transcriptional regulator